MKNYEKEKMGTTTPQECGVDLKKVNQDSTQAEALQQDIMIEEDDLLDAINVHLAEQICSELEKDKLQEISENSLKKRKYPIKLMVGIVSAVLIIFALFIFTPGGRNFILRIASDYAYGKMNYDDGTDIVIQEVEDDIDTEDELSESDVTIVDPEILWNIDHSEDGGRWEEGVYNILLLGEEAIDSGSGRGRSDLMIIATLNTNTKTYKLTSLMRDMLVQIPGYEDNKLNSAYGKGGVLLLYETIELNFDITLDGYAKVGFDSFERIIDKLGGVYITLTASEANYLNSTNYISNPSYRNVVAGENKMNGNQALGYCRIRYVATGDSETDDYGRTSRQRILLNAIFEQCKSKSLAELGLLLNNVLPLVTTDIKKDDFYNLLSIAVSMGMNEIENFRIPADHTFELARVRKMSVLIPDLPANIELLHAFIFDDKEE